MVTKVAAHKTGTAPGLAATLSIESPQVETDPETQQSLANPAAGRRVGARPARPPWWPGRTAWISAGGAALVLFVASIVFFVQTKDGAIRVEINDPEIEVSIKGSEIVLRQADHGHDVRLSPGDHTLVVARGDFQFETDS